MVTRLAGKGVVHPTSSNATDTPAVIPAISRRMWPPEPGCKTRALRAVNLRGTVGYRHLVAAIKAGRRFGRSLKLIRRTVNGFCPRLPRMSGRTRGAGETIIADMANRI